MDGKMSYRRRQERVKIGSEAEKMVLPLCYPKDTWEERCKPLVINDMRNWVLTIGANNIQIADGGRFGKFPKMHRQTEKTL
jgi:hypothetical protein